MQVIKAIVEIASSLRFNIDIDYRVIYDLTNQEYLNEIYEADKNLSTEEIEEKLFDLVNSYSHDYEDTDERLEYKEMDVLYDNVKNKFYIEI